MRDTEMYNLKPTKGNLSVRNGIQEDLHYIAVDAVQLCRENNCPVHRECPYIKDSRAKCAVEKKYLEAVVSGIISMIREDMTQLVLNKITLHLLPLFQQLVRFQIEAYAVTDVVYTTDRGQVRTHPIFKEIRETIKAIELTQKSLGIDGEYIMALELAKDGAGRMRKVQQKGYAEEDFRDRWNRQSFKQGLGLRNENERPRRVK